MKLREGNIWRLGILDNLGENCMYFLYGCCMDVCIYHVVKLYGDI